MSRTKISGSALCKEFLVILFYYYNERANSPFLPAPRVWGWPKAMMHKLSVHAKFRWEDLFKKIDDVSETFLLPAAQKMVQQINELHLEFRPLYCWPFQSTWPSRNGDNYYIETIENISVHLNDTNCFSMFIMIPVIEQPLRQTGMNRYKILKNAEQIRKNDVL
jgi:hypothetical protein